MNRRAVSGIVLMLLLTSMLSSAFNIRPAKAETGLAESPWPMFLHDPQHTGRSPFVGPQTPPDARVLIEGERDDDYLFLPTVIGSDGTLYLGARKTEGGVTKEGLFAFNPDGSEKWFYGQSNPRCAPTLFEAENIVYVLSYGVEFGGISAVNAETGNLKWRKSFAVLYGDQNPVIRDSGILYFIAGCILPDGSYDSCLIALDKNGVAVWVYAVETSETYFDFHLPAEGSAGFASRGPTSAIAIDREGTTICFGYNDTLFALNSNGAEKWRKAFNVTRVLHPNVGTPSIGSDGTIYVPVEHTREDPRARGNTGSLYGISPDGAVKWEIGVGYGIRIPLIGPDGSLYISYITYPVDAAINHVTALDPEGHGKWSLSSYGSLWPRAIDAEGTIYITESGALKAVNPDGSEKWKCIMSNDHPSSLSIGTRGTLYVSSRSKLYAIGPGPAPPPVPPQPINLSPANGATDVSFTPQLLSSPPLQDVPKELITWEEIDGFYVTRVDSQWQISTIQGDYSDPLWNSTLTDGLIDRRSFPDLPDAWANYVPSGVLDYEITYYWRVRHRDFRGVWSPWSEETSFTIRQFYPPKADFDYSPTNPKAGETVELDASASRPWETWSISHYGWDLDGDGVFDGLTTSPVIYYRWDKSGTYSVTLEVVNWVGDKDSVSKEIVVEQNSLWERTWAAIKKKVFGPEGPTEEDLRRFEIIKRELRLEDFDEFYDSNTPMWVRDMQILTAIKEKIAPEEGEITCEQYILQILHDMELVDSYVNHPWGATPEINVYFTNMAEVSKWAELGLLLGGVTLEGLVSAAGGSGVGIGVILMVPDVVEAGISLKLLYKTLYERERWLFFNDIHDQNLLHLNAAQRDHLQTLKDEYAEPLRTRREEFKNEVREELRKILNYVLEKYKLWPVQAYQMKSPVELRVYDSQGNVAGLVDGNVNEEIAGSVYVDGTVLIYPAADFYYFVVAGAEQGTYGATVISARVRAVLNFAATDIPTSAKVAHQYTIDWDALSLGEEGVTVEVDADGDGVFEHTFTSDGELTHGEFIIATDKIPPETWLSIGEPKFVLNDLTCLTSGTPITLMAEGNAGGSGVALTTYRIYNAAYDSGWTIYTQPFYLTGLSDGAYDIDFNSTDVAGNIELTNTVTVILDNTGPLITVSNPPPGWAMQDGVTFMGSIVDPGSGVSSTGFSIREANGGEGSPIGFEDLPVSYDPSTGEWSFAFDTLLVPDGYYVLYIEAEDNLGNEADATIPYSIRNWAVLELLPASENNKAGRTMPVKFALRVAATVDPLQPFVYNEELIIDIYATDQPDEILQESTFGDHATDYRINSPTEVYITNFRTLRTPKEYRVEVYRKDMLIDWFTFETMK